MSTSARRNRRYVLLAVLVALVSVSVVGVVGAQETRVGDVDDLRNVSDDLSGDYFLTGDIDVSDAEIAPIGGPDNPFVGTFDGNGNTIRGLTIENDTAEVGLFGRVGDEGVVSNVALRNVDVSGGEDVGALVGRNQGEVSGSYVTGSGRVSGGSNVGGLVGRNLGTVTRSYSTVSVRGGQDVGGLVGRNVAEVTLSYSTSDVVGDNNVGGLVGYSLGDVTDTYATGSAEAETTAGGLVGHNRGNARILRSYSAASVDATAEASGIVGRNTASVEDSYYDTDATGQSRRFARDQPGTALTKDEMVAGSASENMEGFDFGGTWVAELRGYPSLAWESEDGGDDDGSEGDVDGDGDTSDGATDGGTGDTDASGSPDDTDSGTGSEDASDGSEGMPGFGPLVALLSVAVVCLLSRR